MINENLAERAKDDDKLKLGNFPEFVGLGIVPVRKSSREMAVAVYVSRPLAKLSDLFKVSVPASVVVFDHGSKYSVPTKIVNIGDLRP
ncbi:MAG: hypothetical protein ABI395_11135 [Sphingobium sp.]